MKKIYFFILIIVTLTNCSSVSDAGKVLRNEKIKNSDEFLVKKRDPLVLPPDFKNIPEPGSINEKKIDEEKKIKRILKAPKTSDINSGKSSSIEESILDEIKR